MTQESGKVFLTWVLANIIGCAGLAVLLLVLPALMSIRILAATALILTLPISLAQWLALRRFSRISAWWILSLPIGLLLALLILRAVPPALWQTVDDESVAALTAGYLLIGFMVGLPQWWLLRQQFSNSLLWLFGSALGMGVAFAIVMATDLINRSGVLAIIVAVLAYVLVTGLVLSSLPPRHPQSPLDAANVV